MVVSIHSIQEGYVNVFSIAGRFSGRWMNHDEPETKSYLVEINIPRTYYISDFHIMENQLDSIEEHERGYIISGKVTSCDENIIFLSLCNDLIMIEIVPDNRFYALINHNVSLFVREIELYKVD